MSALNVVGWWNACISWNIPGISFFQIESCDVWTTHGLLCRPCESKIYSIFFNFYPLQPLDDLNVEKKHRQSPQHPKISQGYLCHCSWFEEVPKTSEVLLLRALSHAARFYQVFSIHSKLFEHFACWKCKGRHWNIAKQLNQLVHFKWQYFRINVNNRPGETVRLSDLRPLKSIDSQFVWQPVNGLSINMSSVGG